MQNIEQKNYEVNSLPLKDVIESLAKSFKVDFYSSCEEYFLYVPPSLGQGQIRGINFDNGLGIIIYNCRFKYDVRIEFTVDEVHPVKYLYAINCPVTHNFANESEKHKIKKYKSAIVASEKHNGHVLNFDRDVQINLVSLEIDRKKFVENKSCELASLSNKLKNLFHDIEAKEVFYHEGYYGLEFLELFDNISKHSERSLIRKFYLESSALQIFVKQLIQFEDDLKNESRKSVLRVNELDRIIETAVYIKSNLAKKHTIHNLSRRSGLNPNKLQAGFKYIYRSTVNEFISNERLDRARTILNEEDISIGAVALRVGFENGSYFSKMFKRRFGINPKQVRLPEL